MTGLHIKFVLLEILEEQGKKAKDIWCSFCDSQLTPTPGNVKLSTQHAPTVNAKPQVFGMQWNQIMIKRASECGMTMALNIPVCQ